MVHHSAKLFAEPETQTNYLLRRFMENAATAARPAIIA
jgi:G:T-mismatch repair DNA endonuclease (very short patch repair protein)